MTDTQPRFLVRAFVAQWDYPVFAEWLIAHGREVLPQWALPDVGFVVQAVPASNFAGLSLEPRPSAGGDNDEPPASGSQEWQRPLAMAFGYQDGRVGVVTWLTARPGLGPRAALAACSLVTAAVETELERRGVRLMISPTERPSLVKFMRRRGWRVTHAANVLLYKMIDDEGARGKREPRPSVIEGGDVKMTGEQCEPAILPAVAHRGGVE